MSFSRSLKEVCGDVWEACYRHPFVQELGAGTLPKESFQFYLAQDYSYLYEYARVFALGAVKARDEELMANFSKTQSSLLQVEMELHRGYMKQFGISLEQAERTKPSLFNRAYTGNMLAVAQTGGVLEILMTLFPCAWTYYDFAVRLKEDYGDKLDGNFYRSWIEMYAGEEFLESFSWFFPAVDRLVEPLGDDERRYMTEVFRNSTEFEYLFWDMSYKRQMSFA